MNGNSWYSVSVKHKVFGLRLFAAGRDIRYWTFLICNLFLDYANWILPFCRQIHLGNQGIRDQLRLHGYNNHLTGYFTSISSDFSKRSIY